MLSRHSVELDFLANVHRRI